MLGFSLSPGGLLLPYHLGALASLSYHGYITDSTALAGSSAGAIAVASHASGVDSLKALDASTRVSAQCFNPFFVAGGGLLPSLQSELDKMLPPQAHQVVNEREGLVALAHRELFPNNQPVLATEFPTRQSLMDAVCDSSMFPYFLTNGPARTVKRHNKVLPRVVVDGVFACPWERIGCPELDGVVDRTVTISVFPPKPLLGLTTMLNDDKIGPELESTPQGAALQTANLVRMATQGSTKQELRNLYENGWSDAERWANQDKRRQSEKKAAREQQAAVVAAANRRRRTS